MRSKLPDSQTAHAIVVGIHKQAFFGRLAQYGIQPENEKEAAALLDLGVGLMEQSSGANDSGEKTAADQQYDYGDGFFANCLRAFDQVQGIGGAPGFEGLGKQANSLARFAPEPQFPQALIDSAYDAAYQLAHDPAVYGAAVVKRAENEQVLFEMMKQAGMVDDEGNFIESPEQGEA